MEDLRLIFIGFGTVARGCARHLIENRRFLEKEYGFRYKVVAIHDLEAGSVEDRVQGIDLAKGLEIAAGHRKLSELGRNQVQGRSTIEALKNSGADVLVESTWTNLKDGEPGLSHIATALENGMDVATSNKGPIALAYRHLKRLAQVNGRQLRFESTVMSGTPLFSMCESGLAGAQIRGMRGILNGTTNYILTEMANGKSYGDALKVAQELGYAEADPTGDVEAHDPAAKITILANALMGADVHYAAVERVGISSITVDDLEGAARESKRVKLIASASKGTDGTIKVSVKPTLVPNTEMLAHLSGIMNALQISMDAQPDVTVVGPGAGGDSAGYGLLSDLLAIHRSRK